VGERKVKRQTGRDKIRKKKKKGKNTIPRFEAQPGDIETKKTVRKKGLVFECDREKKVGVGTKEQTTMLAFL